MPAYARLLLLATLVTTALAGWAVVRMTAHERPRVEPPVTATRPAAPPVAAAPSAPPPARGAARTDRPGVVERRLAALAETLRRDAAIEDLVLPAPTRWVRVPRPIVFRRGLDFWHPAYAAVVEDSR